MKVGVMSTGPTLENYLGAQAKRSGYLLIVDLDSMRYLAVQNRIQTLHGPATGKLFAQVLVQNSVDAVLAGSFDPDIRQMLCKAGLKVIRHDRGITYRILEELRKTCQSAVS